MSRCCLVGVTVLAAMAGCTQVTTPSQPVSPPPTPSASLPAQPSASPSASTVIPPKARGEIARDVLRDHKRVGSTGRADLGKGPWVAQGACDGPVGLSVSYQTRVDGVSAGGGSINCSTGKTYTNSVLPSMKGTHQVEIVFGAEVENTTIAYVRIIPEGTQ